jgi:transposase
MALKRRQFTREFKLQVIREIEAGKGLAQAAREYQLHPRLITPWRQAHQQYAAQAFAGNGKRYKEEARIAELERLVGQLLLENALLRKAWLRLEGQLRRPSRNGGNGCTP